MAGSKSSKSSVSDQDKMSPTSEHAPSQNGGDNQGGLEMDTKVSETRSLRQNASVDELEHDSDSSDSEDEHSHHIDPNTCRGKLAVTMHTNAAQYFVIFLVIVDCLIIAMELLIDMEFIVFPEEDHHSDHNETSSHHNYSASHHYNHSHHIFDSNQSRTYLNLTDHEEPHHHTNKEKAEHALHALSLAILSVFMVEVSIKVYVERSHILTQKAEVFDAVVVVVSFTLDVIFSFVSVNKAASEAAGLMVILRLWRVTRIINGVILSLKMDADKKMAVVRKAQRVAEKESKKLRHKVERLERENANLREQLNLRKSTPPQVSTPNDHAAEEV